MLIVTTVGRLGPVVAPVQIPLDLWRYGLPLLLPHGVRGVVVWITASDIGATTPSLVIWEGEEGSEAGYLIKADWDFQ